jgi:hypothetical protein
MATYSFRTDDHDESNLEFLKKEHGQNFVKRNTILRAALEGFKCMGKEEREHFIREIRSRDSRRCYRYG